MVYKKRSWPKKRHRSGRPSVITPEILDKLRELFSMSLTDDEACLMTWISRSALMDYCLKNEQFREQKELLKRKPSVQAKFNLVKDIKQQDSGASKWRLERKSKEEFSLKQEVESNNISLNIHKLDEMSTDDLVKLINS